MEHIKLVFVKRLWIRCGVEHTSYVRTPVTDGFPVCGSPMNLPTCLQSMVLLETPRIFEFCPAVACDGPVVGVRAASAEPSTVRQ